MKAKAFHGNILIYRRFLNCLRVRPAMKIFSKDVADTCSSLPSSKQGSWIFNSCNLRDWPNHKDSSALHWWSPVGVIAVFVTRWSSVDTNWENSSSWCVVKDLSWHHSWHENLSFKSLIQTQQSRHPQTLIHDLLGRSTTILGVPKGKHAQALLQHSRGMGALRWQGKEVAGAWDHQGGSNAPVAKMYPDSKVPHEALNPAT